jgi:hypothetical protein
MAVKVRLEAFRLAMKELQAELKYASGDSSLNSAVTLEKKWSMKIYAHSLSNP